MPKIFGRVFCRLLNGSKRPAHSAGQPKKLRRYLFFSASNFDHCFDSILEANLFVLGSQNAPPLKSRWSGRFSVLFGNCFLSCL